MIRFGSDSFQELAQEVGFALGNLRHPNCTVEFAGKFYEDAAECLRAHAILRLLIDAEPNKFSSDLTMSGQARRAWLRRCKARAFSNYYCALSRSASMIDAIAANNDALALEIFELSPADWMQGDEYEEDFCYQRYIGLLLANRPANERAALLTRFAMAAEPGSARLEVCQALDASDADGFELAFENLLRTRKREIDEERTRAEEDLAFAIGTKVFVEGVAILKLAQTRGIAVATQVPMCPALAMLALAPATPDDEFAVP